jgi:hypothetical protein
VGTARGDLHGSQVKLTDFGYLRELALLDPSTFGPDDFLAVAYSSPEMRELKKGNLTLEEIFEAGITLDDLLKANDVWMLGQVLYFMVCRPSDSGKRFFAETYSLTGFDGLEADSGLTASKAAERLMGLGLETETSEKLRALLFDKIFVAIQKRSKDAGEIAEAITDLGADLFLEAQDALLQYAWPYFVPSVRLTRHQRKSGEIGAGVLYSSQPLFEADLKFVKVSAREEDAGARCI